MSILQNPFGIHAQAFRLREQRTTILASNIANMDTPNYKARDLDFGGVMASAKHKRLQINHQQHFDQGQSSGAASSIKYRLPLAASLDGNTVEINVENSLFTDNALRYHATTTFLNSRIKGIMSALRGE